MHCWWQHDKVNVCVSHVQIADATTCWTTCSKTHAQSPVRASWTAAWVLRGVCKDLMACLMVRTWRCLFSLAAMVMLAEVILEPLFGPWASFLLSYTSARPAVLAHPYARFTSLQRLVLHRSRTWLCIDILGDRARSCHLVGPKSRIVSSYSRAKCCNLAELLLISASCACMSRAYQLPNELNLYAVVSASLTELYEHNIRAYVYVYVCIYVHSLGNAPVICLHGKVWDRLSCDASWAWWTQHVFLLGMNASMSWAASMDRTSCYDAYLRRHFFPFLFFLCPFCLLFCFCSFLDAMSSFLFVSWCNDIACGDYEAKSPVIPAMVISSWYQGCHFTPSQAISRSAMPNLCRRTCASFRLIRHSRESRYSLQLWLLEQATKFASDVGIAFVGIVYARAV